MDEFGGDDFEGYQRSRGVEGDASSLKSRNRYAMGDKVWEARTPQIEKKYLKVKKEDPKKPKSTKRKMETVLSVQIDRADKYIPRTPISKQTYPEILAAIQSLIGDAPSDVVASACTELMKVLKSPNFSEEDQRRFTNEVLDMTVPDDAYYKMYHMFTQINDYQTPGDDEALEDGEDAQYDDLAQKLVESEDDGSGEDGEEKLEYEEQVVDEDEGVDDSEDLALSDIHELWLFERLGSQEAVETVLSILGLEKDREVENRLMTFFGYKTTSLATTLMNNRWKLHFMGRLHLSKTDLDRETVIKDMKDCAFCPEVYAEYMNHLDMVGVEPTKALNLKDFEFEEYTLMNTTQRVEVPGATRTIKGNYEEISIPAPPPAVAKGLVEISELPVFTRPAFQKMTHLNTIQSAVYPAALQRKEANLLVCAPTGAGKTNIAMLAILAAMEDHVESIVDSKVTVNTSGFKVVYIAPMKALVAEVVSSFSIRLKPYGINVRELSGDVHLTREQIGDTQMIVTTPEKWDIITRKSDEARSFVDLVNLLIFDEIHLLHDRRGAVIETIVMRTQMNTRKNLKPVRMVGLSATLPNYKDVAEFLRVPDENLFFFGSEYRPCPLSQVYIGVDSQKAIKRHQIMNEVCYEQVIKNAGNKQSLVFVHSRKDTFKTAKMIMEMATTNNELNKFFPADSVSMEILKTQAENLITQEMKELLINGIGVHHAGLPRPDRTLVEDLFAGRHLQVLVSTSTLAWGVNLPAAAVIIKGTQCYKPEMGEFQELGSMDILQMLGRAGRPQYDRTGEGIVITLKDNLQYYLSLNNCQQPVESQLIHSLADILNAEVVLGNFSSRQEAVEWLGESYLYIRMLGNPWLYQVSEEMLRGDPTLVRRRTELVHSALILLDKDKMVAYDRRTGKVKASANGRIASFYYLKPGCMNTYEDFLHPNMDDIDILQLFSMSSEFTNIPVRAEERPELEKLIGQVPIAVKNGYDSPPGKINMLVQCYVSKLTLKGFALAADLSFIAQSGARLFRALFEMVVQRGWSRVAQKLLVWCQVLENKFWSTQTPLRHFDRPGLNEALFKKIEKKDFGFNRLFDLSASELSDLLRDAKAGDLVHKVLCEFPRLNCKLFWQPITRSLLFVEVTITPNFKWNYRTHGKSMLLHIFCEDVNGEHLLHHSVFVLPSFRGEPHNSVLSFYVTISDPLPPLYYVKVYFDKWLLASTCLPLNLRKLSLPEKYTPCLDLVTAMPLPSTALAHPPFEEYFQRYRPISAQKAKEAGFDGIHFLPVETQMFQQAYETKDNILVTSASSSGGETVVEFCIMNQLRSGSLSCIMIAPVDSETHCQKMQKRLSTLGVSVAHLTGDLLTDYQLLGASQIVVGNPKQVEGLTRKWRKKKVIRSINLLICLELELLDHGGIMGTYYEVAISRMRHMAAETQSALRVCAAGSSLATSGDLADWLGVPANCNFNFQPDTRNLNIEVVFRGFPQYYREIRHLSVQNAIFPIVQECASSQTPVLIFVTSRHQARQLAIDILIRAGNFSISWGASEFDVQEKILRETMGSGILLLHEGLQVSEADLVRRAFLAGESRLLIVTHSMLWKLHLNAPVVMVADCEYYDAFEQRYLHYEMPDVLRMQAACGRCELSTDFESQTQSTLDNTGIFYIFCLRTQKEYYKKFLHEPFPLESKYDQYYAEILCPEIANSTVESRQECVDLITWTYFYRRLTQNPNYYGCVASTPQLLSAHLSSLVEDSVEGLEQAGVVEVHEDVDKIAPLSLCFIAAHYQITTSTIETFHKSMRDLETNSRAVIERSLLEILSNASEFEQVPIPEFESNLTIKLMDFYGMDSSDTDKLNCPHTKALLLLLSHIDRVNLPVDLQVDQHNVLIEAIPLLHAMVDIVAAEGSLQHTVVTLEILQSLVQANAHTASYLRQLPHMEEALIQDCKAQGIEEVFHFAEVSDEARTQATARLSQAQLAEVAEAANRYPSTLMNVTTEATKISVQLTWKDEESLQPVICPFFPRLKMENWWVILSQEEKVLDISKLKIGQAQVDFELNLSGTVNVQLVCDSYQGCDQEEDVVL